MHQSINTLNQACIKTASWVDPAAVCVCERERLRVGHLCAHVCECVWQFQTLILPLSSFYHGSSLTFDPSRMRDLQGTLLTNSIFARMEYCVCVCVCERECLETNQSRRPIQLRQSSQREPIHLRYILPHTHNWMTSPAHPYAKNIWYSNDTIKVADGTQQLFCESMWRVTSAIGRTHQKVSNSHFLSQKHRW